MHQVLCDGGLANRLNTLFTALVIQKHAPSAWGIAWPVSNWCGAPLEDLFATPLPVTQNSLLYFKKHQNRFWNLFHENQIGFDEQRITYNKTLGSLEDLCNQVRKHHRVAYFHHAIPGYITDADLQSVFPLLCPQDAILQQVNELAQAHHITAQTIGVHIRKTDFGDMVNEQAIYDRIAVSADHHFICSDDPQVLDLFGTLPNCACIPKPSLPKKLNPNGGWNSHITDADGRVYPFNVDRDRESVIWALIDLLLLSKTRIALTSSSSFLALAQRLGRLNYLATFQ